MDPQELKAILENLLLAADQPVTVDRLKKTFINQADREEIKSALIELAEEYQSKSLQIIEVAGGYQLSTRSEYSEWIRKFLKLDKTTRLSQPSLDTLSIVAYKQPITRQEVDDIRGVDSSGVIRTLLEKKVIAPAGRKPVPGKPVLYRTTQRFLEYFGLKDLSDMPTLEDLKDEEILGDAEGDAQTQISFEPESAEESPEHFADTEHQGTTEQPDEAPADSPEKETGSGE